MNNFIVRTLSGFFFVLIIIGSIWISPYTFAIAFAVISGWTVYEFHKLTNQQSHVEVVAVLSVIGTVILFTSSFLYVSGLLPFLGFSAYGLFIMIVLVIELYRKKYNPIHNWAYFLLGQIIIALPFALLNFILYIDGYYPLLLMSVFIIIWVNDTGAYLVGVNFGKTRMFPRISPKKSWEGFIGGAVFALVAGYIFSLFIPQVSLISWLIFSEIIVLFGTFGDLLESALKRTICVKDSGTVIPGHGGLMDRFDSMLLVAPAVFIFLSFLFK